VAYGDYTRGPYLSDLRLALAPAVVDVALDPNRFRFGLR
jgi:hypothetical protein